MKKEKHSHPAGKAMLIVKGKTPLSEAEFLQIAKEREPLFKGIPGLIQKYYIKASAPGEFGGVYVWDSMESLKKFKESNVAATIAQAYKSIEPPSTEVLDIMFQLRE
jgi:heme-degrading monooxygenase HmoA